MAEVRTHYSRQESKVFNTATETKLCESHDLLKKHDTCAGLTRTLIAKLLNVEIMGQPRYINKSDFSVVNITADNFVYIVLKESFLFEHVQRCYGECQGES